MRQVGGRSERGGHIKWRNVKLGLLPFAHLERTSSGCENQNVKYCFQLHVLVGLLFPSGIRTIIFP